MYSMTGYGKGAATENGKTVTVELKSVNHRYLDLALKLPRTFLFAEDSLKKLLSSSLSRGHIDVFLTYDPGTVEDADFQVDVELAKSFLDACKVNLKSALSDYDIQDDITLGYLAKLPDVVVRRQREEDENFLTKLAMSAAEIAISNMKTMREREGAALKQDISEKIDNIAAYLEQIKILAPKVVENYRAGLEARIAEVLVPDKIDAQRLATEVALYADHCAIDEEITRLTSHISAMRLLLNESVPVGRKMEFLIQEFNREANTIGSKANDLGITNLVLAIKNEIEKVREQAANVE